MYHGMEEPEELIGKKIECVMRNGEDIAFVFSNGQSLWAVPEGDCCSHTWIEHVSGINDIKGRTITETREYEEGTHLGETDDDVVEQDCLALYGMCFIRDDLQRVDIDYRNESNGYYGGWLNWKLRNDVPDPAMGWKITGDF